MILKGSERGNAAELARHLLNDRDNDHVELHELRGFACDDLREAMAEADAIAKGTRCRKFLFSLSLSPPEHEDVSVANFEAAVEMVEQRLGLEGQPRAIVFHEKEGRRHAHAVWSRIDAKTMTARNLPFYKTRLMEVSKELYLEHGWEMPRGFIDRSLRNPLNFSRAEYQQAKRARVDPRMIKAAFKDCWSRADSADALKSALEEKGYFLARGDRRGVVAVDWRGECYALARYAGVKAKEVKERFGDGAALPSLEARKAWLGERMSGKLKAWADKEQARLEKQALALTFQRQQMVQRQRAARRDLDAAQDRRRDEEQRKRAERLPKGLKGVWSWITGNTRKIRLQNEVEALRSAERDRAERDRVVQKQLAERRALQKRLKLAKKKQQQAVLELTREAALYTRLGRDGPDSPPARKERQRGKNRDGRSPRGPALEP